MHCFFIREQNIHFFSILDSVFLALGSLRLEIRDTVVFSPTMLSLVKLSVEKLRCKLDAHPASVAHLTVFAFMCLAACIVIVTVLGNLTFFPSLTVDPG